MTFVFTAAYLIFTQGLFGESFIAVILGLPWSFLMALLGQPLSNPYMMVLTPIVLNVIALYWIGFGIEKLYRKIFLNHKSRQ